MPESPTPVSLSEINPSPDSQHSDDSNVDSQTSLNQIQRLGQILQNRRRPQNPFDVTAHQLDSTGSRSFDQICIQDVAGTISINKKPNSLDAVSLIFSTLEDGIVRVQPGVDGAPVRGGSAHGVTFLRVYVQTGECTSAAVKAFSRPTKAFAEFINTQEIARRGILTLEPIAVIIDHKQDVTANMQNRGQALADEPIGYYLSRMEPIRSMDRLRVIKHGYLALLAGDEQSKEYIDYVNKIGEMLAQMHLKGIFPGDAQVKNFAIKNDGTVIPIDFENVDIFNENFYETNPEKFVDLSVKGLRVLFDSLNGQKSPSINFFKGFSGEALWRAFDDVIFAPYSRTVEDSLLDTGINGQIDQVEFVVKMDVLLGSLQAIRESIREYITKPANNSTHG